MKFVIWGLGSVGSSFLRKLKDNNLFDPQVFHCVDPSDKAKECFLRFGGIESHFTKTKIDKNNILEHLEFLEKDDFLLDFAIDIKNLDILEYCLGNDIHYLCTADSSWNPDPLWTSEHQHYLEYVKLKQKYPEKTNTCLIQFGMNPGLVSSFAKQCLKDIVNNDHSRYVRKHREELQNLIRENKYALLCQKLKVTDIQEVDNDDQKTDIAYQQDICYSTWNCWAYYYETVSSPEIAFGSKKRFHGYRKIHDCDINDLYMCLYKAGFEYPEMSYSPQGMVKGHLSTHEEIFTIRDYFSIGKYKPTVHFLYSPCDYATRSVEQFKENPPKMLHLIDKTEITEGGESVGIIIQGKRFTTRYFGNYLDTTKLDESATISQVSASSYAGFLYMREHPKKGLLFPEDVNSDEVLRSAKQYLKEYQTFECPKMEMSLGKHED